MGFLICDRLEYFLLNDMVTVPPSLLPVNVLGFQQLN